MPHPYRGKEKVRYGHKALLERPLLTAHIGAIASLWTIIEEAWGLLLADMLDADAKVGVSMYLAIQNAGSKTSMLTAAADMALTDQKLRTTFGDLIRADRDVALERNRIVHGRWGILPSRDDLLILGERDWLIRVMAEVNHHYGRMTPNALALASVSPKFPPLKNVKYDVRDFLVAEERLSAHTVRQEGFTLQVREFRARKRAEQARSSKLSAGLMTRPRSGPAAPRPGAAPKTKT